MTRLPVPVAADVRRRTSRNLSHTTSLRGGLRVRLAFLFGLLVPWLAIGADQSLVLRYSRPAEKWIEALPIGNGRLGGMLFGNVTNEHLQFNEDTLWTGQPHEYQHEGAVKVLPTLRQLLFEGKQAEAEELGSKEFMSEPLRQKAYQPFGDVRLVFPGSTHVAGYRRELNLDTAVAGVEYVADGARFKREILASYPDQSIAWRISADKPGRVTFTARLDSPHPGTRTSVTTDNQLELDGQVEPEGLRFTARLRIVLRGGILSPKTDCLEIANADSVLITLAAATSFKNYRDISADPGGRCDAVLKRTARKTFQTVLKDHLADYQPLFRRVKLDLGKTESAELPTDERLKNLSRKPDPQLSALYFQFGRYLLIGSSRPGTQPANLQGIWNDSIKPPWDSKWTVNINTEMNYWPAEVCNLSECHEPLFDLITECAVTGRRTAQEHYGARGWVLHHNTDLWRGTAPINRSNHGIWVTGGAWLCRHLWEHYLFTGDKDFLRRRAYPLMKEASLFFVDYLVRDPKTGWLISGPSNSPEQGGLVMGPTMDHQIIRDLFANTMEAAALLQTDSDLSGKLGDLRKQIAPNQIGRHGQLQEWLEDKDDPKNDHRHCSHLWAVYPGCEITPRGSPAFSTAARQSLLFRGDGGTGWSKAWKINFWARFLDGDHAHKMLAEALAGNTYPNLFDAHPPFQIDGNFGATAGIAEMLLQSHETKISASQSGVRVLDLLPALPTAWPDGSVTGLRARDGFEIDLDWKNGRLVRTRIRSLLGKPCEIRANKRSLQLATRRGKVYVFDAELKPT